MSETANFVSISRLAGKCAAQKFKNFCSSSLWTCLHHMVIIRSQNKIIDFLMILAYCHPEVPFGKYLNPPISLYNQHCAF